MPQQEKPAVGVVCPRRAPSFLLTLRACARVSMCVCACLRNRSRISTLVPQCDSPQCPRDVEMTSTSSKDEVVREQPKLKSNVEKPLDDLVKDMLRDPRSKRR